MIIITKKRVHHFDTPSFFDIQHSEFHISTNQQNSICFNSVIIFFIPYKLKYTIHILSDRTCFFQHHIYSYKKKFINLSCLMRTYRNTTHAGYTYLFNIINFVLFSFALLSSLSINNGRKSKRALLFSSVELSPVSYNEFMRLIYFCSLLRKARSKRR